MAAIVADAIFVVADVAGEVDVGAGTFEPADAEIALKTLEMTGHKSQRLALS
jgi:hypothetical protein